MLDINKAVTNQHDPEGNMFGLDPWSPLFAQKKAEEESLFLTDKHWEIIVYLRERYREAILSAEPAAERESCLKSRLICIPTRSRRFRKLVSPPKERSLMSIGIDS